MHPRKRRRRHQREEQGDNLGIRKRAQVRPFCIAAEELESKPRGSIGGPVQEEERTCWKIEPPPQPRKQQEERETRCGQVELNGVDRQRYAGSGPEQPLLRMRVEGETSLRVCHAPRDVRDAPVVVAVEEAGETGDEWSKAEDGGEHIGIAPRDRKSTRLNSSHSQISYAVFCLKKKKTNK